jgi:hypothetical protein
MTMYAHGYEVVQKPALDLTRLWGLRWIRRVAWLRVAALAFSFAAWGAIIFVVRGLIG